MKTFQAFLEDVNTVYAQKRKNAESMKQKRIQDIINARKERAEKEKENEELENEIVRRTGAQLETELDARDKKPKK